MEEAFDLANHLPLSYKTPTEEQYIAFLWDTFETNYTHGKYQFAFLAYHMLAMSSIYFNIWQIKKSLPDQFAVALVGFNKDMEKFLLDAISPFAFSRIQESTILRFLKLISCGNDHIGKCAKLVEYRNNTAHANGNIFLNTEEALDYKIREVLAVVGEIQSNSTPLVLSCYKTFLLNSYDLDTRNYMNDSDQIREVLIHENYFSQADIDVCKQFDLSELNEHSNFMEIHSLHWVLTQDYRSD